VLAAALGWSNPCRAADELKVSSPDDTVHCTIRWPEGRLQCAVTLKDKPVIETSPLRFTVDGVDLADGVAVGTMETRRLKETYPWRGVPSRAVNFCTCTTFPVRHVKSNTNYTLEVRVFNDAAAFRYVVPGGERPRVPDEATTFVLPAGSTVWYHDLEGHYEGVHVKKKVVDVKAGEWVAPPLTFKLPDGTGYASITEAALVNYSGMALQADGRHG